MFLIVLYKKLCGCSPCRGSLVFSHIPLITILMQKFHAMCYQFLKKNLTQVINYTKGK